jgi:hypothetical protein
VATDFLMGLHMDVLLEQRPRVAREEARSLEGSVPAPATERADLERALHELGTGDPSR